VTAGGAADTGTDHRLARLGWIAVAVNVAVILWGAVVRATGSGAGCGSHWPLCNGEVVPQDPSVKTLIEFGHRLTSGFALLVVAWLVFRVLRARRGGDPSERSIRRLAWLSLAFILGEAAIGAGIVLFEYVAANSSPARAVWMGFHLLNTFLLLGALALLADRLGRRPAGAGPRGPLGPAVAGLVALGLTGATGAVAALGDTLFPAASLAEGMSRDFGAGAHFLERLRVFHPLIAIGAGLLWLYLAQEARRASRARETLAAANAVTLLVFVQFGVGLITLGLLAPVALQIAHLLCADLLWMAGVLLVDRSRSLAAT
jgi:heme A synthase